MADGQTPKRPTVTPPPALGPARAATPSTRATAEGPSGGAPPRVAVGVAGPPKGPGANASAPKTLAPKGVAPKGAAPESLGSGGAGAVSPVLGSAPAGAPAGAPRIAVGPARAAPGGGVGRGQDASPLPGGAAKPAAAQGTSRPAEHARAAGTLEPGHTVRDMRRPTGTVTSNPVVADVMRASGALVDLLEEENAALRKHDIDTVRALAERKQKATRYYRERMLKIQKDPSEITELPEDERDVVREMACYLDSHLAENGRLLKSAKACSERLMGLFVDAVRHTNADKAAGYAPDGRLSEQNHNPSRMSLSFNENL
ncbi:hypothetical protein F1188_09030 [Roseospira marina]|uniref:Flagellar protein FlgN n=1 Tax=Roseospira marina TaxID=140057 RepID=A0A5M6IBX7_9PROT|nr:hypothetical protein [Roseospira marina]KAA5605756.1 hypothetical protein F1188_09030 [Roseospira marina]MBB4313560.1 hypothetical protein [Roseospira marina]MBB5086722.1 hypothetical protein [Roseospira marina]